MWEEGWGPGHARDRDKAGCMDGQLARRVLETEDRRRRTCPSKTSRFIVENSGSADGGKTGDRKGSLMASMHAWSSA